VDSPPTRRSAALPPPQPWRDRIIQLRQYDRCDAQPGVNEAQRRPARIQQLGDHDSPANAAAHLLRRIRLDQLGVHRVRPAPEEHRAEHQDVQPVDAQRQQVSDELRERWTYEVSTAVASTFAAARASGATHPLPEPARQGRKPAWPSRRDESANPSRKQRRLREASQCLEWDSRTHPFAAAGQPRNGRNHVKRHCPGSPPALQPYHES